MAAEKHPNEPDYTASDLLSPNTWPARVGQSALALDVTGIKVAVELQNMRREEADACIRRSLDTLREATASDCVFLALLDPGGALRDLRVARSSFSACRPE